MTLLQIHEKLKAMSTLDIIGTKIIIASAIILPLYVPETVCDPKTIQGWCAFANLLWLWRF